MRTFRFMHSLNKDIKAIRVFIPLLLGGLILLQSVLPAAAIAYAAGSGFQFGTSQALDQAGVSVVRLVATYNSSTTTPTPPTGGGLPPPQCTGLGVIIKSWTALGTSDQNTWVLTDGALVDPNKPSCSLASGITGGKASQQLATIEVFASTAYTNNAPQPILLGTYIVATGSNLFPQNNGTALFAFHTAANATQPFIDVDTTSSVPQSGVELQNSSHTIPSQSSGGTPQQFLTPVMVSAASTSLEQGMPWLNAQGRLAGMNIKGTTRDTTITSSEIMTVLNSRSELKDPTPPQLPHANPVHDAWNRAVSDYYTKNYRAVQVDLAPIGPVNAQFAAATGLSQQATAQISPKPKPGPTAVATPPTNSIGIANTGIKIPYWELGVMALIILIAILLLISLLFMRRRTRRRREMAQFEEEQKAAEEQADLNARRIAEEEAKRKQTQNIPQPQPQAAEAPHPANGSMGAMRHNGGYDVANEPTIIPARASAQSPQASQPTQPTLIPSASISDEPTLDMRDGSSRNGIGDIEKTEPFTFQRWQGRNMSLAVGTRSDPGIKRKYKPNEDSLFAAQGAGSNDASQQFGLFVVADGMGGHANGQDASRLGIQTIINDVLPRVAANTQADDAQLSQLLVNGVQAANAAVHQRNIEHSADMGTTMTAALIVGSMAYVANVGDSRTYLYREPEGLKKVTHDHSVVASLVEAGIIQPDEVYSHPKRSQIYRSLGEKPEVEIDSFTVALQPGDKLLLCSDGLWEMVRDPDIQRILSTPVPNPDETGSELIKAALEGGGEDNVSAVVVHITEATRHTGRAGIQLIAKPETTEMPKM